MPSTFQDRAGFGFDAGCSFGCGSFAVKKGDSFPRGRRCVFFAKPFYKQAYFLRARL
jgi:hypothetical protein